MTPPRSDHFNGKTFFQPHHLDSGRLRDLVRWKTSSQPKPWPAQVALSPQPPPASPRGGEVVVTWIGHATFLLQTNLGNLLTDPVFSERVSPVSWLGPRRVHPPGIALAALPPIHTVLLSHDHYDHCDLASLRYLAKTHSPTFVAPLRHQDLLRAVGAQQIVELDWWQTADLPRGVTVALTPAKHWSNRLGTPRNHRLWGGFSVKLGPKNVWFAGDSGYDVEIFRTVGERYGPPNLALIPIGAFEPRWFMAPMHMNPAEAVQVHRDVGARQSIGMHWGTFQLTDEGREEPVAALEEARHRAGFDPHEFRVMAPGESHIILDENRPTACSSR